MINLIIPYNNKNKIIDLFYIFIKNEIIIILNYSIKI